MMAVPGRACTTPKRHQSNEIGQLTLDCWASVTLDGRRLTKDNEGRIASGARDGSRVRSPGRGAARPAGPGDPGGEWWDCQMVTASVLPTAHHVFNRTAARLQAEKTSGQATPPPACNVERDATRRSA